MPPPLCTKCKGIPALEGDLWCLTCTAWEAVGRELVGHWDSSGARAIAGDVVVTCARQVRALRSLGAGLARGADREEGAGVSRAPLNESRNSPAAPTSDTRPALTRRSRGRSAVEAKSEVEETEEEESEESEEESVPQDRKDRSRSPIRKRGPPGAAAKVLPNPPGEHSGRRKHSPSRRSEVPRASEPERDRRRRRDHRDKTEKKKRPGHRAGRNHQRLHRCATDPYRRVHRKASGRALELSSAALGREALDRV